DGPGGAPGYRAGGGACGRGRQSFCRGETGARETSGVEKPISQAPPPVLTSLRSRRHPGRTPPAAATPRRLLRPPRAGGTAGGAEEGRLEGRCHKAVCIASPPTDVG